MFRYANPAVFMRLSGALLPWISGAAAIALALATALAEACGARMVTVCRELTKQFESVSTLPAAGLPAWLSADANRCRGEFVLVVHALAALAELLFAAPEQPIAFGAGDLSFYKDIATMDPHPGFLNGILSLLLNSAAPEYKFNDEEQKAVAYFHRARAAELVALFDSQFPKSPRRPALKARLVEVYAAYGSSDGVIRAGKEFLAAFPTTPLRTEVALRMADAYARKEDSADEFATYDALLKELAERAGGVPLGEGKTADVAPSEGTDQEEAEAVFEDDLFHHPVMVAMSPEKLCARSTTASP